MTELASPEAIEGRILLIRDKQVMLDSDLAELYGVRTKHLNEQVKRNPDRFPEDFVFHLTEHEAMSLSRLPGTNGRYRGRCHRPYAFTEPGAGMLASVLRGPTATRVAIEILRAFRRLRQDDEPPTPSPEARAVRGLFAAIRDAVLLLREDLEYITKEPFTYFIQAGADGPIKIGSTKNLPVRLRSLCTMSPVPLKLLGIMEGDAEDRCHFRLGAFRLHGEWFAPSPVVLEFIRENAVTPPNPSHTPEARKRLKSCQLPPAYRLIPT